MRSVQTENSVCPSKGLICGCPSFRGRWFFGQGQRQVDSQKDVHWEHLRSQAKSYNLDVFDAFPSIPFSCVSCLLLCTNHTLSPHTHTHTTQKYYLSQFCRSHELSWSAFSPHVIGWNCYGNQARSYGVFSEQIPPSCLVSAFCLKKNYSQRINLIG